MGGKATHKQFGDILNRVLQIQEAILARIMAMEVQLSGRGCVPEPQPENSDPDIAMVEPDPKAQTTGT
jgi:hypothetical protein